MTQYIQLMLSNCHRFFSKTMQLFLLLCVVVLPNVAYGQQKLSEEHISFVKVSGQVGTATSFAEMSGQAEVTQKTAGCLIVFSPQAFLSSQEKSVKEVFCRYELDKTDAFFMDDDKGRITIIGKNSVNLSDAVLQRARSQSDFLETITAFFQRNGYELPVNMDVIATFMSSRDFPNGDLVGNPPTQVYILELDYLAENTDDKTFAFFVHNLIQRRGTLKYTEREIENLMKNNEAFKNLTHSEVRKLLTLELGSLASHEALKILEKEEVKAILLDKNAKALLEDGNVRNILNKDNVPNVLTNVAVQSILNNENAVAMLSDSNLVAFLHQEEIPELFNNPTFQAFLQQNQDYLTDNISILKFAVFVGSQLEVIILIVAWLVILLFQWRLSAKTRYSLVNLEKGKHGNAHIIQGISDVKNQQNVDSEAIRQKLFRLEDILEENYGITTVKTFLQMLSRNGLPELEDMELSALPDWAANQFESQKNLLVLLPPANALITRTVLSSKREMVAQIKAKTTVIENKEPAVEELLNGLDALVQHPFHSEAEMWGYLLQKADDKWLVNLVAILGQYLSMQQKLDEIKKNQEALQTQLSERFRLPINDKLVFSEWTNQLLKPEGTWILVPPQFIDKLQSHHQTIISHINKVSKGHKDKQVLQLLRAEYDISTGWHDFLNKPFQSSDVMAKHLSEVSEQWVKELLTVLNQYFLMKAEPETVEIVLSERFSPTKAEKIDFSLEPFRTQQGIWRRLQLHFIAELQACEELVDELKKTQAKFPACKKVGKQKEVSVEAILELLYVDDIAKGWKALVNQQFSSDNDMLLRLFQTGDGRWIHKLLRANDLLQAYFTEQPQFQRLSSHLAEAAHILATLFRQMNLMVLGPKLLEPISETTIPKPYKAQISSERSKANNTLRALKFVQEQVAERLNPDSFNHYPQFVVDIETYGFVYDPKTDNPTIRVTLTNPSDWNC